MIVHYGTTNANDEVYVMVCYNIVLCSAGIKQVQKRTNNMRKAYHVDCF